MQCTLERKRIYKDCRLEESTKQSTEHESSNWNRLKWWNITLNCHRKLFEYHSPLRSNPRGSLHSPYWGTSQHFAKRAYLDAVLRWNVIDTFSRWSSEIYSRDVSRQNFHNFCLFMVHGDIAILEIFIENSSLFMSGLEPGITRAASEPLIPQSYSCDLYQCHSYK